jgi:cytochrome c
VAVANAENNIGKEPLAVSLSSKGTFDKDAGDVLKYEWRVTRAADPNMPPASNSAPTLLSTEQNPTVTFDQTGVFNVELVVTDSLGATRAASVPVLVGNARPVIRFVEPQAGDFFDPEHPIRYSLYVNDPEDGTNDFDEAEEKKIPEIDPSSTSRVTLNALFSSGPIPSAGGSPSSDQGPSGMRLMKGSDCFNCHAVDQKRVGPPLLEIATKYRGKEGALEASVQRVLKGSTGVWGKIPMIPHSHHTPDEIRDMVGWVYSLEPSALARIFNGFVGQVPVTKEDVAKPGHFTLEASYIDRGVGEIPALTTSAMMYLRQRLVEAETADEVHGPQVLGSGSAGGGKFIGAINHDHFLRFNGITLDRVKKLTLKVASAGAGGEIEIRLDKPDGPLLGKVSVEVNGQWEKFYEKTVDLAETKGRHDLFVRFVNEKNQGGLMNLDSIYFHP